MEVVKLDTTHAGASFAYLLSVSMHIGTVYVVQKGDFYLFNLHLTWQVSHNQSIYQFYSRSGDLFAMVKSEPTGTLVWTYVFSRKQLYATNAGINVLYSQISNLSWISAPVNSDPTYIKSDPFPSVLPASKNTPSRLSKALQLKVWEELKHGMLKNTAEGCF